MKTNTKWHILRWLQYFGYLFDGVIGIISFGFYQTDFSLKYMKNFMDYNDKINSI